MSLWPRRYLDSEKLNLLSLAGKWSAKRFSSSWTVTAYGFLFAAGGLGLANLLAQPPQAFFSLGRAWDGWFILATLALVPTVAGFGLYTLSLRYLPAGVAGLIASLEPVLTAIMAIFLLGEWLDTYQWLGAGLILLAVVLAQTEAEQRAPEPELPAPARVTQEPRDSLL
jgi:drug/metabolite transporter (DMT)-like permease